MGEHPARDIAGTGAAGPVPGGGSLEPPVPVDAPEAAPPLTPGRGSGPSRPSTPPLLPSESPVGGDPDPDAAAVGAADLDTGLALSPPAPPRATAGATAGATAAGPAGARPSPGPTGAERGATTINDGAVAKLVAAAVRAVPGVHALGSTTSRALGQIRDAVGQPDHAQGISVEVGDRQVAVDVTLVAAYPWPLQDVARDVRAAVYDAVESLVGKDVTEVNVTITDIDIPEPGRPAGRHPEPKERRVT